MLLNTVTEMAYVGLTTGRMRERLKQHLVKSRRGVLSALYDAMREWPDMCCWEAVILERSDDIDELLEAERRWILELETHRPGVGYNSKVPDERYWADFKRSNPGPYEPDPKELAWFDMDGHVSWLVQAWSGEMGRQGARLGASHDVKSADAWSRPEKNGFKPKRREEMTEEERERARENGRKSVEAKGLDFYRETGKRGGAAKHKVKASSEEMSRRARVGQDMRRASLRSE